MLCDLSGGGAERLVLGLCRAGLVEQAVATVQGGGVLEPAFAAAGVPVWQGGRRPGTAGAATAWRLARHVRGVDLVHTHLFAGDAFGRVAGFVAGVPVVTTEHNVNRDERAHHRLVKRALAPVARRVAYVSEAARAHAEAGEGIRHPGACVVPNGVDLARFRPAVPGPGTRLLAVGRDVPQKGFDVLLRALPDGVTLRIAGRSTRRGTQRVGGATVEWLGEREDVPELLAASDLLVVPSRWEGFGLAAVEGMAAGVPVVASAVDGLVEVLGDAGVLVPPESPTALRAALERLIADPAQRAQRGAAGLARARRFSLERCAERYRALYAEVLQEAAGR